MIQPYIYFYMFVLYMFSTGKTNQVEFLDNMCPANSHKRGIFTL